MEQLSAFFAKLETLLGIQAPYLKTTFKVALTLISFFVVWLILRQVLRFVEKRMHKVNLIEIQGQLFKIFRKALLLALVLITGIYIIRLFNAPLLEKIFLALFIILFANPVKKFLVVTIRYLQARVARKTDSKIDDIVFDLLIRFSDFIVYTVAIIIALDTLGMADCNPGRINERDARHLAFALLQIGAQGHQHPGHQFDKAIVADQVRKLTPELGTDVFKVIVLEISVARLMEMNDDGHNLADR